MSSSTKVEAAKHSDNGLENTEANSPSKRAQKGDKKKAKELASPSLEATSPKKKKHSETGKVKGSPSPKAQKATAFKAKASATKKGACKISKSDDESVASTGSKAKAMKINSPAKKKASAHQRITEWDEIIPKLWDAEKALAKGLYTFKILSWNVNGLRALVRKQPAAFADLCKHNDPDLLCLPEMKLQETNLDDLKMNS
jgi:hypothetical protein